MDAIREKNLRFKFCGTIQNAILLGRSDLAPMIALVWDELKFIPIIGYVAGIEVGVFFFSPHLFQGYPQKNLFDCPSISNPNYLPPPHQKP